MSQGSPDENQSSPYATSLQDAPSIHSSGSQGDGTGGMIPYKNPAALAAYYLGIFSFIPLIGLFLAVPAFVLGILGLRAKKRTPAIRGSVHAWIGIILGGIFSVVWGLAAASIIVGITLRR